MTKKHKIEAVLYHLFVCLFGLLMIYPVLWMISGSLKNNTEILNGGMTVSYTHLDVYKRQGQISGLGSPDHIDLLAH